MIAGLMSVWFAAALGQVSGPAAEAAWLKSVPADVEVVARVRGVEAVRDDLVKMLGAMSPALSAQAGPVLEQVPALVAERFGKPVATAPSLLLFRLPKPGEIGTPPYAVLVRSDDYPGVQKQLAGPASGAKPEAQEGGFDQIKGPDGLPILTFKGPGFVAFGNNEFLMGAIARPKATLDAALGEGLRARLLGGDVGLYVNLEAVQRRYSAEIEQAKQGLQAAIGNAPQAGAGGPDFMKAAGSLYGTLFDALKDAQAFVINFDFGAEGLSTGGEATTKPGTATAKALTAGSTATGDELARYPAELTNFMFFNGSPSALEKFQNWGFSMIRGGDAEATPELNAAVELHRQAGIKDMSTSSAIGPGGMRGVTRSTYADPRKAVESVSAMLKAMKASKAPLARVIKDLSIEPDAERYRGFVLSRSRVTYDLDEFARLQPNVPNAAQSVKAILGEGMNTWYGTDGKVVLSIIAPDWEAAKALIDATVTGRGSLGETASYRALRPKLPGQVNGLFLVNAQGLVRQYEAQLSAILPDKGKLPAPVALPKDPVLFGGSITTTGGGLQFQAVVPGAVGEVVEKGLVPLFQGMTGRVNQ